MLPLARRLARCGPGGRRLLHTSPPADPGVLACRLASRAVVRFRGPEAARFLNSLLTNDILSHGSSGPSSSQPQRYAPTPNVPARAPPPQYAALLTPQGRFLYDLFLYRPAPRSQMLDRTGSAPQTGERPGGEEDGEGGEVLADVDAAEVDELLACFKSYALAQWSLGDGRMLMDAHKMVTLSGVVVASTAIGPGKVNVLIPPKDGTTEDGVGGF